MTSSIPNVRDTLARHALHAKKNYGQHFLADGRVLEKIVAAAELKPGDFVIEVGAGLGALTAALCEKAGPDGHVVAYEIDERLLPVLTKNLSRYDNLTIINEDVLKADINALLTVHGETACRIVANLPYYITTPFIFKVFEDKIPIDAMVLMVQREVADRLLAPPGGKDYGALTVNANYYADMSRVANVPQNCFVPRPDVDSAVVKFTLKNMAAENERLLFSLIRAAFSQRRKTLVNCLHGFDTSRSKDVIAELLVKCGFAADIRGEALSVDDFIKLAGAWG